MDMSAFVVPRSDQLNSDDLLAGPLTITITRVSGTNNAEQPVAVYFDGDNGKPYKPCKSMRRVMVAAWGVDAAQYVGRSMTLYRDPKVAFGGLEIGGIRISHMSHLDKPLSLALTITKAKRAPYKVHILSPAEASPPSASAAAPAADPPQQPAGTLSDTQHGRHRIPLVNPDTGHTRYADTVPAWCAGVAEMLTQINPHDAWDGNSATYVKLLGSKSEESQTALAELDAAVKTACAAKG